MAPFHPAQRRLLQDRRWPLIARARHDARTDLSRLAAASLLAAVLAAIARVIEPFDHGIWLVSYLFLVGFLGLFLLGRGQAALLYISRQPPPRRRARRAQLVLWTVGVIAVPFGVFADARLAVVVGSLSLLAALASFWNSARPVLPPHAPPLGWRAQGYVALMGFMAASVVVGTALAWDIQWL